MSTPNSNNIALIHTHLYVYIAQFRAYFLQNQPFSNPKPIFYVCDFNGKAPLKICYLKKVCYLYTPCERSLRSLAHGCSQNRFVLRLNVNDKFKQYCTNSRISICAYCIISRIFFTKSTVFRVQTPHFYVYCFNENAYPYVKIPTVMSV